MARSKNPMYCHAGQHHGAPGVLARVPGKRMRFFANSKFNGPASAMRAAKDYVAKVADRSRVNLDTGRRVVDRKKGGVTHIVRTVRIAGRPPYTSERWIAHWQEKPGVNKRKEFSVQKYGKQGAEEKARAHRAAMVKRILGG